MRISMLSLLDKNCYDGLTFNEPFDNSEYERHGELWLEDELTHAKIAYIRIIFYNLNMIKKDEDIDMEIAIDNYTQNCYEGMMALIKSKLYKLPVKKELARVPLFDGYMDEFYVYPQYRRQGIGSYLIDNLSRITEHMFNMPLHCVSTFCVPKLPGKDPELPSTWIDDYDDEKYKYNKQFFEKHNYKLQEWEGQEYFCCNYSACPKHGGI